MFETNIVDAHSLVEYNKNISESAGLVMAKIREKIFKILDICCCLLCHIAVSTALINASEVKETSRLVLVISSPNTNTLDKNGKLTRQNEVFPLQTLTEQDIKTISKVNTEEGKAPSVEVLKGICSSYITKPSNETAELLYLLSCRKQQNDRILIDKMANEFKISDNYKISPFKLFFVGSVSNDVDLKCDNLIEKNGFVSSIVEDYTHILMGKMPTKIIESYSEQCLSSLLSEIDKTMETLGKFQQFQMILLRMVVLAYEKIINVCMLSQHTTEVYLAYNLIYKSLYKERSNDDTYLGEQQSKNLMHISDKISEISKEYNPINLDDNSLKTFLDDCMNDDYELNSLIDLLSIANKLHSADIADGSVLDCTEQVFFGVMCDKMSILSGKIRDLLLCLRHLKKKKNS